MKIFKKILIVLCIIATLFGVFLAYLFFFFNVNTLKTPILIYLNNNKEYKININGTIELGVYPHISLKANEISLDLSVTQPHSQQPLLHFKQLSLAVDLWPLLQKKLSIKDITFKEGTAKYENVNLKNMNLNFKFQKECENPLDGFNLKGEFNLNYFADPKKATLLNVYLDVTNNKALQSGTITAKGILNKDTPIDLNFKFKGTGMPDLTNPLSKNSKIEFTHFQVQSNGMRLKGNAEFFPFKKQGLAIFTATLPGIAEKKSIILNTNAKFDLTKNVPFLDMDANIPSIEITALAGDSIADGKANANVIAFIPKAYAAAAPLTFAKRFSNTPFDLTFLNAMDAKLNLKIKSIKEIAKSPLFSDVVIKGNLAQGRFTLTDATTTGLDGIIKMSGSLTQKSLQMKVAATNITLLKIPGLKESPLKKGKINFSLDVNAIPSSLLTMMNTLNGKGNFNAHDVIVHTNDVKGSIESIQKAKNLEDLYHIKDAFDKKANLLIHTIKGNFTLQGYGLLNTDNTIVEIDEGSCHTDGTANFDTSTLNLKSKIQLKAYSEYPPLIATIQGSLYDPNFSIDQDQLRKIISKIAEKKINDIAQKSIAKLIKKKANDLLGEGNGGTVSDPNNPSTGSSVGQSAGKVAGKLLGGLLKRLSH